MNYVTGSGAGFAKMVERFSAGAKNKVNILFKNMVKSLFADIIMRTPVHFEGLPETGRTRANWQVASMGSEPSITSTVDTEGTATVLKMAGAVNQLPSGIPYIDLVNKIPWINDLEYGLYKKDPAVGSYNRLTGEYEIRSVNGFSKQAPQGMVRVAMASVPAIVQEEVAKIKVMSTMDMASATAMFPGLMGG